MRTTLAHDSSATVRPRVILVVRAIWIDHFRGGETRLTKLLNDSQVLGHPWVIGEHALGHLVRRTEILGLLHNLPGAVVATDAEVLTLIDRHGLFGLGIGYVDAHLVAATMLRPGAQLWTRDKRLASS